MITHITHAHAVCCWVAGNWFGLDKLIGSLIQTFVAGSGAVQVEAFVGALRRGLCDHGPMKMQIRDQGPMRIQIRDQGPYENSDHGCARDHSIIGQWAYTYTIQAAET